MAPWKLPLIVAALALPTIAAFMTAGPGLGVATGALAVLAILIVAALQRPSGPISSPAAPDSRRRLLVVVTCPVEDPRVTGEIAHDAGAEGEEGAEVLLLAPVRVGFLDRWASDIETARRAAQRDLVVTVAALARVGVAAEARVGDEDLVQAVEDQLQSFPASEVIVVSPAAGETDDEGAALEELETRLKTEFRHLVA